MRAPLIVSIAFLFAGVFTTANAAEEPMFTDFTGQPKTIESYTGDGKWLVVMVWAHNCHVCNQEAEGYAQFHETHKDRDATVLGLSIDGEAGKTNAEDFVARHDLPFPNLIGEPQQVMMKYRMLTQSSFRGTPSVLIYDRDGTLKAAQAGAVPISSIEAYIARSDKAAETTG